MEGEHKDQLKTIDGWLVPGPWVMTGHRDYPGPLSWYRPPEEEDA